MTQRPPADLIDVEKFEEPEIQFLGAYRWRIQSNPDHPYIISDSEEEDRSLSEGISKASAALPLRMDRKLEGGSRTPSAGSSSRSITNRSGSRPTIKQRVTDSPKPPTTSQDDFNGGDSDDEFLSVDIQRNWQPFARDFSIPLNADEDMKPLSNAALSVKSSALKPHKERGRQSSSDLVVRARSVWESVVDNDSEDLLWVGLQNLSLPTKRASSQTDHTRSYFSSLTNFSCKLTPYKAPGAINHVAQSGQLAALACSTPGGGVEGYEGVNPYNLGGTLLVISNENSFFLDNHQTNSNNHSAPRYCTVNSVQFDPLRPTRLVSSGCDGTVKFWNCDLVNEGKIPQVIKSEIFKGYPFKLLFNSQGLLAVSDNAGYVSIYFQENLLQRLKATRSNHLISGTLWDHNSASQFLYISSTSQEKGEGTHRVYDVAKARMMCVLNNDMAGEALAFSTQGNTLALITHNSEMQHFLELYDVKQGVQSLVQIKLDPHVQTQKTLKIGDMAFSPDGIYLALGRRDNRIQIYDSRYLTKDPVLNLAHGDRVSIAYDLKNGQEDGITKVEWIQEHTGHVGLVTGGADGCVHLWNTSSSQPQKSYILAETDYDIGDFSLGDLSKNEIPLIVGNKRGCILTT